MALVDGGACQRRANAGVAALSGATDIAARTAVVDIAVRVDLAAICGVAVTILEAGIAGLDGASPRLAGRRCIVD